MPELGANPAAKLLGAFLPDIWAFGSSAASSFLPTWALLMAEPSPLLVRHWLQRGQPPRVACVTRSGPEKNRQKLPPKLLRMFPTKRDATPSPCY